MKVLTLLALILCMACDSEATPEMDTGPGMVAEDAGMISDDAGFDTEADGGESDGGGAEPDAGSEIDPEIAEICAVLPGFEQACWVDQEHVTMSPEGTPARDLLFPGVAGYNMNGWEWWQQWPGGHSPTFEYDEATDEGIVCSVASAMRFAAILHNRPEALAVLWETTTWEGRFFNWNDDYSAPAAEGDADGAVLWAWRDYLIKWISQTARDGSCFLPTREMLESAITNCQATADAAEGNIQGCTH